MFIDHDLQEFDFRSVRSETFASESHISLLRSKAVLFAHESINISPLCGEAPFMFRHLESAREPKAEMLSQRMSRQLLSLFMTTNASC